MAACKTLENLTVLYSVCIHCALSPLNVGLKTPEIADSSQRMGYP